VRGIHPEHAVDSNDEDVEKEELHEVIAEKYIEIASLGTKVEAVTDELRA
jgi:hypothetical protein